MGLGRREFVIAGAGAVALSSLGAGCGSDGQGGGDEATFAHGVASFDPLTDRVLLWTRVQTTRASETVRWVVASDPELATIVREGEANAAEEADHTVRVDVDGLSPGTTYYYAFFLGADVRSAVGRTRTLPSDVSHVRLAFTSCANFNNGYFHAYRNIAKRADLDVWVHLGDYIYEYAEGEYGDSSLGRLLEPPHETVSLEDYRARYANYRSDPDLQEIHRQHPCILVWDDHEFANNAYTGGAENHMPSEEGDWEDRKRAASQAFLEWLPMRVPDADLPPRIYRSFAFGDLFDLIMLDTRIVGRDMQSRMNDVVSATDRELLGADQASWLEEQMIESQQRGATWRLLGNQIILSPVLGAPPEIGEDLWNGYPAARQRLFDTWTENGIDNIVVLTGDIHTSWAAEVIPDPVSYDAENGSTNLGVEFVGTSVTSLGLEEDPDLAAGIPDLLAINRHFKFSEVTRKGYVLVDITPERVQGEWYFVANHKEDTEEAAAEEDAYRYKCNSGDPRLVEVDDLSAAKANAPKPAP